MSDNESESEVAAEVEAEIIRLAYERAYIIVEQFDEGMLQGDVPAEAGVLVSRGVLALAQLFETGTQEHEALDKRCKALEGERNVALRRARAAEAEQLPMAWYWCANFTAEARGCGAQNTRLICRANPQGGDLQMVGMVPDKVQTACLARISRLNAARLAE